MKNKYFIAVVALLIGGSVFTGCNNKRENVEDAKDNVKEAKQELKDAQIQYEKEWQQFKSDAELKINANEKKISEFRAGIKTAKGKFRAKYEKEVVALEQKNIELRKKLSEYKYESKDNWEAFKTEFNNTVDNIGNGLNDIFSKKK